MDCSPVITKLDFCCSVLAGVSGSLMQWPQSVLNPADGPLTSHHEARLLLFSIGWCVWIADAMATVCVEPHRSTSVLSEEFTAHNSTPPWTPLTESSGENSVSAARSGTSLYSWHGATIPCWVTALNHWWWSSSPPQIGQHVYSLHAVDSPVHAWGPGISSGCCSCMEQLAIWCQIYDVLGRVSSAIQDSDLRGVLWITGQLPPFHTVWPNAATFSSYSAPVTVHCDSVTLICASIHCHYTDRTADVENLKPVSLNLTKTRVVRTL